MSRSIIYSLTKEELRRSGFAPIAPAGEEEEWWSRCPPIIEVKVSPEEKIVRYCFDYDKDGMFRGVHSDDHYEEGEEAVNAALEVAKRFGRSLEEFEE